jgi:hypothetical protein
MPAGLNISNMRSIITDGGDRFPLIHRGIERGVTTQVLGPERRMSGSETGACPTVDNFLTP